MQEDFKSLKPEQLEALKQLLGEADNAQPPDVSDWFDGKRIDEIDFCEYLLQKKERKCIHGKLYDLDGTFTEEKEWTMNRLPVRYDPDAPKPEKWLAFLNDLLEKTDH